MQHILWAATPTPSPSPDFDPNLVTPGVVGFVVTLALIVATIVAIVLGVVVLGEDLSSGLIIGFPVVLLGCWLAATGGRVRPRPLRRADASALE